MNHIFDNILLQPRETHFHICTHVCFREHSRLPFHHSIISFISLGTHPGASFRLFSFSLNTHTHVTRSLVSLISIHDCNQFLLSSRVFLVNAPKLVLSFIRVLLIRLTLGGYPFRLEISIDLFADVRQEAKYGRPAGCINMETLLLPTTHFEIIVASLISRRFLVCLCSSSSSGSVSLLFECAVRGE